MKLDPKRKNLVGLLNDVVQYEHRNYYCVIAATVLSIEKIQSVPYNC